MADASSMTTLIQVGLTKIQKASSRKHKILRKTIQKALDHISNISPERAAADRDADKYFLPFKLACETAAWKLMDTALDTMQKLIAYGYLRGSALVDPAVFPPKEQPAAVKGKPRVKERRRLIDVVIETIYECSMYENDKVQLQVIKALLTAVTSVTCKVHAHSLLLSVRACYHIYLTSRSRVNQTTAKATLTQMLNIVFQRMEHFAQQLKDLDEDELANGDAKVQEEKTDGPATSELDANQSQPNQPDADEPTTNGTETEEKEPDAVDVAKAAVKIIVDESLAKAVDDEPASPPAPSSQDEPLPVSPSRASSDSESVQGKFGVCIVCGSAANNFCLQTNDPVCSMECKVAHFDDVINEDAATTKYTVRTTVAAKFALLQHDAFLIFRALCKLSMKPLPSPPEPIALASKILSLELILSILDRSGPTFVNSDIFLELVRENLVMSLLQNSVSTVEQVFRLSSSIFITLISTFKIHLKTEIGVFMDNVFLKILSSPNSPFAHKKMALQVFHKICQHPQTLVEVFLNYDCEPGSPNVFEGVANIVEKIAQGRFVAKNWMTEEEEHRLRRIALEVFGSAMKSLVIWSTEARAQLLRINNPEFATPGQSSLASADVSPSHTPAAKSPMAPTPGSLELPSSLSTQSIEERDSIDADDLKEDEALSTGNSSVDLTKAAGAANRPKFQSQYAMQQELKKKIQIGIIRFNLKPKKGIAFLREHGIIDETPESLAEFLFTYKGKGLDRTMLGDYLGDHRDFEKAVRNIFIDKLDFHGLSFDEGIRRFLTEAGFRLPGEAQKIDRMMEKFADQYCNHNPGSFSSADTAYVLAYAVVMLNTDLHSDQIKNKMTKEEFQRNNRGIDNDRDLDAEFMSGIYDRIAQNEIKMDRPGQVESHGPVKKIHPEARFSFFLQESQNMVQQTRELIQRRGTTDFTFGDDGKVQSPFKRKVEPVAEQPASPTSSTHSHHGTTPVHDDMGKKVAQENPVDAVKTLREQNDEPFYQATPYDLEAVKHMFELVWYPVLGTFSILLEEATNPRLIAVCLDGYRYAIRISSIFDMDTPRVAFCKSLKQATLLGTGKEMHQKNVDAVKMLLEIAHTEGNHLRESWGEVLGCISEFDRLYLMGSGTKPKMDIFQLTTPQAAARQSQKRMSNQDLHALHQKEAADTQNSLAITDQVEAAMIDRIFSDSKNLNSEAIIDFVHHLCAVSEKELGFEGSDSLRVRPGLTPRVFSLQKIVEITYYNMGRIRLVWSRIWHILSEYFTRAGCHPNLNVSLFVIDALRQLAMKFLEKDELSNYQFQKQFLKPFEVICNKSKSPEVRELIVQCVGQMVRARVDNIKSGWKSVFAIITAGASDPREALVANAFLIVEEIMKKYFTLITDTIDECVNCLVAFGENVFTDYSLQAIEHLRRCAQYLGEIAVNRDKSKAEGGGEEQPIRRARSGSRHQNWVAAHLRTNTELNAALSTLSADGLGESEDIGAWFLVLTGLSRMIGDRRMEVRSRALQVMFKILHTYGHYFSRNTWQMIFRGVLFPIFDDVLTTSNHTYRQPLAKQIQKGSLVSSPSFVRRLSQDTSEEAQFMSDSWLKTSCLAALSTLVELFSYFQSTVAFLLPEVLALVNSCIDNDNEELSRIGVKCWVRMMHVTGPKFSREEWQAVLESFRATVNTVLPHELQTPGIRKLVGCAPFSLDTLAGDPVAATVQHLLKKPFTPKDVDALYFQQPSQEQPVSDGAEAPAPAPAPVSDAVPAAGPSAEESAAESEATEEAEVAVETEPEVDDGTHVDKPVMEEDAPSADQDEASTPADTEVKTTEPDAPTTQANGDARANPARPSQPPPQPVRGAKRGPLPPAGVPPPFNRAVQQPRRVSKDVLKVRLPFSSTSVIIKCKTQLLLFEAAYEVANRFYSIMDDDHILTLISAFLDSVQFANAFNKDSDLRARLFKHGFMQDRQATPPELFFQEAQGLKISILVITRLLKYYTSYSDADRARRLWEREDPDPLPTHPEDPVESKEQREKEEKDAHAASMAFLASQQRVVRETVVPEIQRELLSIGQAATMEYVMNVSSQDVESQRALRCLSQVVCAFVDSFMSMSDQQFQDNLPPVYQSFVQLIFLGDADVRTSLSTLFATQLPCILPEEFRNPSAPLSLQQPAATTERSPDADEDAP